MKSIFDECKNPGLKIININDFIKFLKLFSEKN